MITGYEECPDRDPPPALWGLMAELSLILAVAGIAILWGAG